MKECLIDGLLDSLKVLPFLFVTFLILEFIEHKLSKKNEKALIKNQKFGPLLGGLLGGIPQCGFSAMGSSLYSSKVITMGTLIAIYLSTSDEMLAIMIGEQVKLSFIFKIIGFKVLVGIIVGLIVDLIFNKKVKNIQIEDICKEDNCDCEHEGILIPSIKHALKTGLFILAANIIINVIIFYIGEDSLSNLLVHKNIFTYFIASLIGLIPNCASSIIITELYLANIITVGIMLSGLLTGCGVGLLLLFRTNKNIKENITILSITYSVGVIVGFIIDLII